MIKPSFTIVLDKRRAKVSGTYPVKLRVIYNRDNRKFDLGLDLSEEDFDKVMGERPREPYKEHKLFLNEVLRKAEEIAKSLPQFSFDSFKAKMNPKQQESLKTVYDYFEKQVADLKKEGRLKTAASYYCAYKSFSAFKKQLSFHELTPEWLKRYENFMLEKGKSKTTIGIYTRTLRAIANKGIEDGIEMTYPFGKKGYTPPRGRNIKKALVQSDIEKLFNYTPETELEIYALDMFLLSYLLNGINMKDLALLQYKNVQGDKISFIRAKTARSNTQQRIITAFITEEVKPFWERQRTHSANYEDYVFPILRKGMKEEDKLKAITKSIYYINKGLAQIAKTLGIEAKITTYTARHSFATVLKRANIPTEFISEALGHSSLATTQNYLDSFEDEHYKETLKALTGFRKKAEE